jgi:hypothetical protein
VRHRQPDHDPEEAAVKTITYETMDGAEATKAGADLEKLDRYGALKDNGFDYPASGVFRLEDGRPVELLGTDGGEPEDQTLGRDWGWVPAALQAAFELGKAEGVAAAHRSEGRM